MFEDIDKKLEEYGKEARASIVREWTRLVTPELKRLSKRINPFAGKVKPPQNLIFHAEPARNRANRVYRSARGIITIWGVHPNIASDPVRYPHIPREGFVEGTKCYAFPVGGGNFLSSKKAQDRMENLDYYGDRVEFSYLFTHGGRVMGALSREYQETFVGWYGKTQAIPAYSTRSLPEMVVDYDGLEALIRDAFEEAVRRYG